MLTFGLLFTKALLLLGTPLQVLLALPQAVLLLPGLFPTLIEQCQTHSEHGIDMLWPPMHAGSFQTRLHHELMTTFHTARADRPALLLIGRILHQVAPLL